MSLRRILSTILALVALQGTGALAQDNWLAALAQMRPLLAGQLELCGLQGELAEAAHGISGGGFWSVYDEKAKQCRTQLEAGLRLIAKTVKEQVGNQPDKLAAAKNFFVSSTVLVGKLEALPSQDGSIQQEVLSAFDRMTASLAF